MFIFLKFSFSGMECARDNSAKCSKWSSWLYARPVSRLVPQIISKKLLLDLNFFFAA